MRDSGGMKRDYIEVRKVKWDRLWHAAFIPVNGRVVSWDRVTKKTALKIASKL